MPLANDIARTILGSFDLHYRLFRAVGAGAKERFERGAWREGAEANRARIQFYDQRVAEAVASVKARFPALAQDETLWPGIKQAYIALLYDHPQPECAETFFNSVACRLLHRRYYRNEYLFWRPSVSTEHLSGQRPTYRCYYPGDGDLSGALREMLLSFELACPFEDLERDIGYVQRVVRSMFGEGWVRQPNFQLQVLASLFFRNKAAYVVGRALNGSKEYPFLIPILRTDTGRLYLDTLLVKPENIGRTFSLARSYFMVDMEVPSAYVSFLSSLLPTKRKAELYTLVGLQKQGKTLLYRDLHEHLKHSTDQFVLAPGTRGMVMLVFTLPSFPYVFKVIRDWFAPPKDADRAHVLDRYQLVKNHDRAGRLADTLEYSHVAFPRERFSPELVEELERLAPSMVERDGDRLVIRHLYVERRMVPLDVYLRAHDGPEVEHAIREYGNAIRELAGANIFPGDLLLKNFGITRFGRVVFYDYDEIGYLTDYNFRQLPTSSEDDYGRGEDWFYVGEADIFPEQFLAFLVPPGRPRELFLKYHADLLDPAFWLRTQERCRSGEQPDVFPYPEELRFKNRFRDSAYADQGAGLH